MQCHMQHCAIFFAILLIRYKTNSLQCEFDHGRIITGFLSGKGLGGVWRGGGGGGGGGGWTPPKALKGFKSPQRAARRPARLLKSPSFFHSCLFFLIQRSSLRPSVPISVSLSSDHIMTELLLLLDERLAAMCVLGRSPPSSSSLYKPPSLPGGHFALSSSSSSLFLCQLPKTQSVELPSGSTSYCYYRC